MLRLFKEDAISVINDHCVEIDNITIYEFLTRCSILLQKLFQEDLFYIHPEPHIFQFIKSCLILLNGIQLSSFFQFFYDLLPTFNLSCIIKSDKTDLILKFKKISSGHNQSDIFFDLFTSKDLGVAESESVENKMRIVREKLMTDVIYYLNQDDLVAIMANLFELQVPLVKDNFQLFLQKILFGYRNFDNLWCMTPRPKVYNNLARLILKTFGINLNLKKVSHWAIPELILNTFGSYFGLNAKLLVICTDLSKFKDINLKNSNYVKLAYKFSLILEFENDSLVKILPVKIDDILNEYSQTSLELMRSKISEKFGYLSAIITIDMSLLRGFIDNFFFKLSKFNPIAKMKVLRMFKKKHFFNMYPELPIYRLLMDHGVYSLFKIVLPIFIDKHEF